MKRLSILSLVILFVNLNAQQNVSYLPFFYTEASFNNKTVDVTNKAVGLVLGEAGVSNGAATYNMPIYTPERPKEAIPAPEISIAYNSLSGDGSLGRGWNVSGLSSIQRTSKTIAHNNRTEALCTSNDEFIWNGQKLIKKTATLWETEIETFAKIESYEDNNGRIYMWEVTTKEGVILRYGGSPSGNATRILAQNNSGQNTDCNTANGSYVSFYLDYMEFPNGQGRSYTYYYPGTSSIYIKSISDDYGSLNFSYKKRSDVTSYYIGGRKFTNDLLLDEVTVENHNNSILRRYNFKYSSDGLNSFLSEVHESSNSSSFNSTIFLYGKENTASDFMTLSQDHDIVTNPFGSVQAGDFNGDGLSDILAVMKNNSHEILEFKVYRNDILSQIPNSNKFNVTYSENVSNSSLFEPSDNKHLGVFNSDFNGDAIDDIVIHNISSANNQLTLTNSTIKYFDKLATVASTKVVNSGTCNYLPLNKRFYYTGDFNGDGGIDYFTILSCGGQYPNFNVPVNFKCFITCPRSNVFNKELGEYGTGNSIMDWDEADEIKILDLDGDSKSEIMIIKDGHTKIYSIVPPASSGSAFTFEAKLIYNSGSPTSNGFPTKWHDIFMGDFNGDGKTDLLTKNTANTWEVFHSTGNDFEFISTMNFITQPNISSNTELLEIGDLNGDGKADIFHSFKNLTSGNSGTNLQTTTITTHTDVYYSNGLGFQLKTSPSVSKTYNYWTSDPGFGQYLIGDFNGDGNMDLNMSLTLNQTQNTYSYTRNNVYFDENSKHLLLNKVKNGYGAETEFTYNTLSRMDDDVTTNPDEFKNNYRQWYDPNFDPTSPSYNPQSAYNGNFYVRLPIHVVVNYKNDIGNIDQDIRYQGGMLNRNGRGFLGFREINVKDNNSKKFTSIFLNKYTDFHNYYSHADNFQDIMLNDYSTVHETDGYNHTLIESTRHFYSGIFSYNNNRSKNLFQKILPRLTWTSNWSYLSGNSKTDYSYDSYGNVTTKKHTNPDNNITITDFVFGSNEANRPALPESKTITYKKAGLSDISYTTDFEYTTLYQVKKTIDFVGLQKTITKEYEYNNSLGLLTQEKITGAGMAPRIDQFVYTPDERFLAKTRNTLGQETIYNMSDKWNAPLSKTGIDGLTTSFSYDDFGRQVTETLPTGKVINTQYEWEPTYTCLWDPSNSHIDGIYLYKVKTLSSGSPIQEKCFDYRGRLAVVKSELFDGSYRVSYNFYNDKNLKTKVLDYNSNGNLIGGEETKYDDFDRVKQYFTIDDINTSTNVRTMSYTKGSGYWEILETTPPSPTNSNGSSNYVKKTLGGELLESKENGLNLLTYTYDAEGKLLKTINNGDIISEVEYDQYGRQKKLIDNSAGTQTYDYNSLGDIVYQTNPNDGFEKYEYDVLGRVKKKTINEGTITYTYFPATGSGVKVNLLKEVKNYNGHRKIFDYDNFGRLNKVTRFIKGSSVASTALIDEYTYDANNNVTLMKTPINEYQYNYNSRGYLKNIYLPNSGGAAFYTLNTVTDNDMPATITVGNETISYSYDPLKRLNGIASTYLNDQYLWDPINGNLESKVEDNMFYYTYEYDNFNRLTKEQLDILGRTDVNDKMYADNGNMTWKQSATDDWYNYQGSKKFAVKQLTTTHNFSPQKQNVYYSSFNRPHKMVQNQYDLNYQYDHNYDRVNSQLRKNGAIQHKRYYAGSTELTYDKNGNIISELDYIYAGDQLVGIFANLPNTLGTGTQPQYFRVHTDYLGSIRALSEWGSNKEYRQYFDAWGNYRDNSYQIGALGHKIYDPMTYGKVVYEKPSNLPRWLYRGYTGHEHLAEYRLINMNARLYDPHISRMLSPDNFVQSNTLQGFNRYAYAGNNPCKYIDPDGNAIQVAPILIGIGVGAWLGGTIANNTAYPWEWNYDANTWVNIAAGGIGGAVGGFGGQIVNALQIGGIAGGSLVGGASGLASSSVVAGYHLTNRGNGYYFSDFLRDVGVGTLSGAVIGGAIGGLDAALKGDRIWDGYKTTYKKVDLPGTTTSATNGQRPFGMPETWTPQQRAVWSSKLNALYSTRAEFSGAKLGQFDRFNHMNRSITIPKGMKNISVDVFHQGGNGFYMMTDNSNNLLYRGLGSWSGSINYTPRLNISISGGTGISVTGHRMITTTRVSGLLPLRNFNGFLNFLY